MVWWKKYVVRGLCHGTGMVGWNAGMVWWWDCKSQMAFACVAGLEGWNAVPVCMPVSWLWWSFWNLTFIGLAIELVCHSLPVSVVMGYLFSVSWWCCRSSSTTAFICHFLLLSFVVFACCGFGFFALCSLLPQLCLFGNGAHLLTFLHLILSTQRGF